MSRFDPLQFNALRCAPIVAVLLALSLVGSVAAANEPPYAGFRDRSVKGLSDEAVADLRAGGGMGLALAAELNGFPGPLHVLELADQLRLTAHQRERTAALRDQVKAGAATLGERIVAAESELDRAFRNGEMSPEDLRERVLALATLYGELRFVHLRAHLDMKTLLTPAQVKRYGELRGYAGRAAPHADPPGHGGRHGR